MPKESFDPEVRYTGKVKWFNVDRGYGFIVPDDDVFAGKEIFAHCSAFEDKLHKSAEEGDSVEFNVEKAGKGPAARNIVVYKGED